MIYSIATILQNSTSIVMLPIYTRYLTPQDYGIAELLSMAVEFIGLIVGVVSGQAMLRFYYDNDDDPTERKLSLQPFFRGKAKLSNIHWE